ncbi:MAG: aldose 1-epimerase family protein [Spirochaetaceae bacterium]|nr:aldose 1-epimerase family protein [Spirochaetaceae bacterium]
MKIEERQYVGSTQQLFNARVVRFQEGRADQMKAIIVKNGLLSFTIMADKCLDIAELSFKGENISFLSKPGLQGRNQYDTNGGEAQHSIMGGAFFTCGLQNIGASMIVNGRSYAMHGRIRTTPAEHLSVQTIEDGDNTLIKISGIMREAELFGRNFSLKRTITTEYGSSSIHIHDELVNESFNEEPFCILYHCNTGYPFLNEDCYMILDSKTQRSATDFAKKNLDRWDVMDTPSDSATVEEMVYMHEVGCDEHNISSATIVNPKKNLAYQLQWNKSQMKNLMEWKSPIKGDYVWAVEPTNATFDGIKIMQDQKLVETMKPFERRCFDLDISIIENCK